MWQNPYTEGCVPPFHVQSVERPSRLSDPRVPQSGQKCVRRLHEIRRTFLSAKVPFWEPPSNAIEQKAPVELAFSIPQLSRSFVKEL